MSTSNQPNKWILVFALLFTSASAHSQLPQIAESRLGVDSVKLESGKRLYGFVLQQRPDRSLLFATDRNWLKQTHPSLLEEFSKLEGEKIKAASQQRVARIETWLAERPDDRGLVSFLDHELARSEDALKEPLDQKKFIAVELTPTTYRELNIQPADRRKIAGLAFQHELESVTTSPVSQLKKRLIEAGVDVESEAVELSQHVTSIVNESDKQWAARKAIVEHLLRKPIEFQGTGTTFIRNSDKPDPAALIAQLMGSSVGSDPISQLGAELGLPEFKRPEAKGDSWWRASAKEAEKDGFRGFTIVRLEQNSFNPVVRVESYFFAMERPGVWFQVAKFVGTANANEQNANHIKSIQDDPQVKSVLDTLQGLGLGNQTMIDQALRHGAATQQALQDASGQLNAFISSNARELDSPPLALQP